MSQPLRSAASVNKENKVRANPYPEYLTRCPSRRVWRRERTHTSHARRAGARAGRPRGTAQHCGIAPERCFLHRARGGTQQEF